MKSPVWQYRSGVPGIAWPAIPGSDAASLLALQFQLERSQWLTPDELEALQYLQLGTLLRHAHGTVPYYRERWRGTYDPAEPVTPEALARLPILTRSDVQSSFEALKSTAFPPAHGSVSESRTSGSTGRPVRLLTTRLVQMVWQTIVLREHRWFQRDLAGKLAAIRHGVAEGEADGWGPATNAVVRTGGSATLPIQTDVDTQLGWLERQQPDYLLSYPSNIGELARRAIARSIRMPRLREVRTMGEVLPAEVRALCQQAWGVPVVDSYSSQEVGYLALQCPEHDHYHVQSEAVLVEVLDGEGRPCAPGTTGRVVVTSLHNFATPLVRYEIGDYAEAGPPCSCGRGLPVLTRVLGRVRNMLVLANGARHWPAFGSAGLADLAPILQQQLVQKDFDTLEVRLVTARPLAPAEEESLRRYIQARLPASFSIRFSYCDSIGRSAGGKFEDFLSEIGAAR